MRSSGGRRALFAAVLCGCLACGGSGGSKKSNGTGDGDAQSHGDGDKPSGGDGDKPSGGDGDKPSGGDGDRPTTDPGDAGTGNSSGGCDIPDEAKAADVSHPTTVVGDGTKESCTSQAFVSAVAKGGIITFNCGADNVLINLEETAKIFNDKGPDIVIDGGGKITLCGLNSRRILYMNTCDEAQVWTSAHCDNQETPRLTVQNLTFLDGNAQNEQPRPEGGAIFASGGRLKIVNSRFFHNVAASQGDDTGGGAVRAYQQYNGLPIYVVNSTFGGKEGLGNEAAAGGALGSIGVSYTVINSVFEGNKATNQANGGGGAIANDGNTYTLSVCGTRMENNTAVKFGAAIFFVSNDRSGELIIKNSTLKNNTSGDKAADQYPGIFEQEKDTPEITNSTIE